jgi:hypothetical protein
MTEKEFIHWLQGYLEGVSYDAQKPNPVIQIILDKIKSITTKKVVFDPDIYHPKTIEVPVYTPDEVPYGEICSCNPKNGGSGICGCIMGNKMVPNPKKYSGYTSTTTTNNFTYPKDKQIITG